jgi:hypothetical protein
VGIQTKWKNFSLFSQLASVKEQKDGLGRFFWHGNLDFSGSPVVHDFLLSCRVDGTRSFLNFAIGRMKLTTRSIYQSIS